MKLSVNAIVNVKLWGDGGMYSPHVFTWGGGEGGGNILSIFLCFGVKF